MKKQIEELELLELGYFKIDGSEAVVKSQNQFRVRSPCIALRGVNTLGLCEFPQQVIIPDIASCLILLIHEIIIFIVKKPFDIPTVRSLLPSDLVLLTNTLNDLAHLFLFRQQQFSY